MTVSTAVDPKTAAVTTEVALIVNGREWRLAGHADVPARRPPRASAPDRHREGLRDDKANVLGLKGVGELGNSGANAAVANAVFNATGVRVREFPITLEKVLPGLPFVDA